MEKPQDLAGVSAEVENLKKALRVLNGARELLMYNECQMNGLEFILPARTHRPSSWSGRVSGFVRRHLERATELSAVLVLDRVIHGLKLSVDVAIADEKRLKRAASTLSTH